MPQPDKQRTRGRAATPSKGQMIAPEGTSGVFNVMGVSSNVAANQQMSGIQIGQQARIIDNGAGLYQAMEGLAKGVERGVQQFDQWETRVAQKRQNDWETELAEYGRGVNGNPKKMAEWARLSDYRPHSKTAKRYNELMAGMEGKEYDAYQDDIIARVNKEASTMDMTSAARHYTDAMKQLDPEDKAFKSFANSTNQLNTRITAVAAKMDQSNTEMEYSTRIFRLGEALRKSGVDAGSLGSEIAKTVAAGFLFFGEDEKSPLKIHNDGSITYKAKDDQVYTGSFKGGLNEELITAIRTDLGNAAGSVEDGTFNTTIARNVQSAISKGVFNRTHTSGSTAASTEIKIDPIVGALAGSAVDTSTITASIFGQMQREGGSQEQRQSHSTNVVTQLTNSIIEGDMPPEQKVAAMQRLLMATDPENNPQIWSDNGFEGSMESPKISKAIGAMKEFIRDENTNIAKQLETRRSNIADTSVSPQQIRGAAMENLVGAMERLTYTGNPGQLNRLVMTDDKGNVVESIEGIDAMQAYFRKNPDAVVSGTLHITDDSLRTPMPLGGGIWMGPQGSTPPQATLDWAAKQRENLRKAQNVDRVLTAVNTGTFNGVTAAHGREAVQTIVSRLGPEPTVAATQTAIGILTSSHWDAETVAGMTADFMSVQEGGQGVAIQKLYAMDAQMAWNFGYSFGKMDPGQVGKVIGHPEASEDLRKAGVVFQLAQRDETRTLAAWLTGEPEGDAAWYLTTGSRYVNEYIQLKGEAPDKEWLRTVKNFDSLPAFMERSRGMVNEIMKLGIIKDTTTDALDLALTEGAAAGSTEAMFAQRLAQLWNAADPTNTGSDFATILRDPDHPDRGSLESWMFRTVGRMNGAAGIDAMINTDGYATAAANRQAAKDAGNMGETEMMSDSTYMQMLNRAMEAMGPPVRRMTYDVANKAYVSPDDYGGAEGLTLEDQAVVHGLRFFRSQLERLGGDTMQGGELSTMLEELGAGFSLRNWDLTGSYSDVGDATLTTNILALYATSPEAARKELRRMAGSEARGDMGFEYLEQSLKQIFVAETDVAGNEKAKTFGRAHFRVRIVAPENVGELTEATRRLLEPTLDSGVRPDLKFYRTLPRQMR